MDNIIENNKIIAEFLDWEVEESIKNFLKIDYSYDK